MSGYGYKRKSGACRHYVRFAPNTGHSSADVGFSPDYVCLSPNSGRKWVREFESAFDPKPTFAALGVSRTIWW
ncbi:MAG: hypothetical protein V3U34_08770, partial [candidate division NC10 bacterium]